MDPAAISLDGTSMSNRYEFIGRLNWFLSPSFDRYKMNPYDQKIIANMIYKLKEESEKKTIAPGNLETTTIQAKKISSKNYSSHFSLEKTLSISKILKKYDNFISHALVHGSLADLNYIEGWSDIDTLIVLKKDSVDSGEKIYKLRAIFNELNELLLEIDPLAHHGFTLLTEMDLKHFNQSLMPLSALKHTKSLLNNDQITFRSKFNHESSESTLKEMLCTFSNFNKTGIFKHHPLDGKYLDKDLMDKNQGMYQLKYLISATLLIPSIYHASNGNPVYKGDSFLPFINKFKMESQIIELFSSIRSNWKRSDHSSYDSNRIPDWVKNVIPCNFPEQIVKLLTIIQNNKQQCTGS